MKNSISSKVLPKEELFKLYFVDKLSTIKCAEYFGVHSRTIINNFELYGWKFRPQNETWIGRKHTEAAKERMSLIKTGKRYSSEVNLKKGRLGRISANKGKTKENSESIRRMSLKLKGRNKFTHLPFKLLSEKRLKENKSNSERVKKAAESRIVRPTDECKKFLLDTLNKCDKTNAVCLFYLARQNNFRMKDIERNFKILKLEQANLIKSKIKDNRVETRLEDEIIIPFLNTHFQTMKLKRQVNIKLPYYRRSLADIILYKNNKPYLIVESKVAIRKNNEKQLKQLKKYLKPLNCQYGLLTNGYRYRWYFYNKNLDELELIHDGRNVPLMIEQEDLACTTASQMSSKRLS